MNQAFCAYLRRHEAKALLLWMLLRVLSLVIALLAFYFGPARGSITSIRSLVAPWYVWDAYYYVEIVRNGYQPGDATANFHPLYPWLSTLVAAVFRDPLFSLLIVSSLAGLMLTLALYQLAKLDCNDQQSWQATALLLVWPASLALFAPYTEALFLLLSVYCLFAARKNQFWLAGLAGGLATLTRQQGIFLVLPIAWEVWELSGRNFSGAVKKWSSWFTIVLVPAGYVVWILYRAIAINDVTPDFSSIQKFIYSVMISPNTYEVMPQQEFLPPWVALWRAMNILWQGQAHEGAYVDAILGVVFIGMFVLSWRYLRTSYRIYSLLIIVVSLSFFPGTVNPYMSLPRHILLAFPVFIGLAARYNFRRLTLLIIVLAICQMALLGSFVWQKWVL